jgi:hypothetical protein
MTGGFCYLLSAISFELPGKNDGVMATETVCPIRNGIGVSPETWMRTGKRWGRRTQSMVGLTEGNNSVLELPDPS